MPLSDGHGGSAAPGLSLRHVPHDAAPGRNSRVRADLDVVGNSCLSADHDVVANFRAARDADLSCQHAMTTDADIVGNLHEIIDLGAAADESISEGSPIDGRIAPDLDLIFDDHVPKLRLTQQTFGRWYKAESFAADTGIAPDAELGNRRARDVSCCLQR